MQSKHDCVKQKRWTPGGDTSALLYNCTDTKPYSLYFWKFTKENYKAVLSVVPLSVEGAEGIICYSQIVKKVVVLWLKDQYKESINYYYYFVDKLVKKVLYFLHQYCGFTYLLYGVSNIRINGMGNLGNGKSYWVG